jgi:hypothetical protein
VWPTRRHEDDAVEPVAVDAGEVVAILDLSFAIDGPVLRATIDTVAVDSVHRRHGLADAFCWTGGRTPYAGAKDVAALSWYAANGFTERFRYLHVHAQWDDARHLRRLGTISQVTSRPAAA